MNEKILVLNFGGQYTELIARRVRECHVYSEIVRFDTSIEEIKKFAPKGIILSGGPSSVYEEDALICDKEIFNLGIPILGICYGMQLITHLFGGKVKMAKIKEYGNTKVELTNDSTLWDGIEKDNAFLMSHSDEVITLPNGFNVTAKTDACKFAAIENSEKRIYGVQFHPEVTLSKDGVLVLKNFLFNACKCEERWNIGSFVKETIGKLKEKIGKEKVILALSGGVDSSVVAGLLNKAIGKNLICIFVDHGFLRKNEAEEVSSVWKNTDVTFIKVDAQDRFLEKIKGVTEPEIKRKIIGEEFIRVFEEEAKKNGKIKYLAQGTIYPDLIESGVGKGNIIKSHHNVGGLPQDIGFEEIIEPIKNLFKDEVRQVGAELGLKDYLTKRQPFPGPGLAIRIIGEITKEKLEILKEADAIFREEVFKHQEDINLSQFFAVLTNTKSVGVVGDNRSYDYTIALRAVKTDDFMTAKWAKIPYEILEIVSSRIVNEVRGVNRVVYDITSKPPATIEWE